MMRRIVTRILDKPAIWKESVGAMLAVALVGGSLLLFWPTDRILKPINSWNVFHYVLGTKYFDELGYFDFYQGILLADAEADRVFEDQRTRDMRTYDFVPVEKALDAARKQVIRERFTDRRWEEFKRDLRAIQSLRSKERWAGPIKDRGYNPSPAWLVVHHPLLNAVHIHEPGTLAFLCYFQVLLYLITFAVAWWAFGGRATLVGLLFFLFYFGNARLKLGGYFSYDWFCYTVCAVALHRKGHMLLAAPLLAYAAMMRGFPALLALYPAVRIGCSLVRLRKPERKHLVFLVAMIATCVLIGGLSCFTGRGAGAWGEWREKIAIHSENQLDSSNKVGLQNLFIHDYETGGLTTEASRRKDVATRYEPFYRVAAAAMLLLTLLAMLRRNETDGMLLGLSAIFAAMMLSRYYFSVDVLLFTWCGLTRRRWGNHDAGNIVSGVWLLSLLALYQIQRFAFGFSMREAYFFFNLGLTLYFLAILGNFLCRDFAWLRGRLRPKAEA
ncbi:MAG TPA: hypothetical protein VM285_07730 [Polyangia bacterium]|nr:hypothetical protein [Polyangia bacterium]